MRNFDKACLFEWHNDEVRNLQGLFATEPNFQVQHTDGLHTIKAICPPLEGRALTLIDPSYETKNDFVRVVNVLKNTVRRFATEIYLLWYPVIDRAYVTRLESDLRQTGIPNMLLAELTVKPESVSSMAGSGVIIINPPRTLQENLQEILPYLAERLAPACQNTHPGKFRLQTLLCK
jgi:23S rRNA (adenine2030-N6)-methyltransferase